LIWPDHLSADYSPQMVQGYIGWHAGLIPGATLLLCVVTLFAVSWRRWPVVTFGFAWLVIAISPVPNILIPSGILIAERTLLVPSVGVMLAIGALAPWIVERVKKQGRLVRVTAGGALAAILALGIAKSVGRTVTWKNNESVFAQLI